MRIRRADARWLAYDVATVLVFVVIGRHSHHHGESLGGVASTAWPFLVGLGVGWAVVVASGGRGASRRDALALCASTVVVGMALRVLAGQGTAVAFIVVALCFLGALMVGGRLVLWWRHEAAQKKAAQRS